MALALTGALALGGCAGAAPTPAASVDQNVDHNTAATGMGLGPQDFRSNGGAFGPDQLSR